MRGPTAPVEQQDIEHLILVVQALLTQLVELRRDYAWTHRDDPRREDSPDVIWPVPAREDRR